MLSFSNITVSYGKTEVLKGLTAKLVPGTFTALIGPNGTGKSSLMKAIAGLTAHRGSVSLDKIALNSITQRSKQIAYMQQDTGATSSLTVIEVVILGQIGQLGLRIPKTLHDEAINMLELFGVSQLAERTLDAISGGQRQLVYLAQALFRKPSVLLLDEPTAALDLRHQLIVLDAVKSHAINHNVVIIAAMHDLTLSARFADRMICLSGGNIYADDEPKNILKPEVIEAVYDIEAIVHADENNNLSVMPIRATNNQKDVGNAKG